MPEEEIARCVIDGKGNKEIATELNMKARTVDTYLYRLFRKYHCSNRTQLAIKILNIVV